MEGAINPGKPFVTPTCRKVKTALIMAAGVVAIGSIALFGRYKPACEENVNKARVQNPVMAEPVQKKPDKAQMAQVAEPLKEKTVTPPQTPLIPLDTKLAKVKPKTEKEGILVGEEIHFDFSSSHRSKLVYFGEGRH